MQDAQPTKPKGHFHYEDFVIGASVGFGRRQVTNEEIVEFARAFDPQPFHLSEEAAKDTNVGRLIASGYHTCAMLMRMIAEDVYGGPAALGAPGVDDVRFLKPVMAGDTLTGRLTCREKRVSKSRPGVGLVRNTYELLNHRGEVVLSWDVLQFVRMRSATEGA